ncbi:MAG: 30S ribosomal protein S6 [Candidatus Omnitrophota bacterium]
MKSYEAMFIISTQLDKDALSNAITQINELITKNSGIIENTQNWGRRSLSFKIKKRHEGVYYLVNFKISPDEISKLNAQYRLKEFILRHTIFAAQKS